MGMDLEIFHKFALNMTLFLKQKVGTPGIFGTSFPPNYSIEFSPKLPFFVFSINI